METTNETSAASESTSSAGQTSGGISGATESGSSSDSGTQSAVSGGDTGKLPGAGNPPPAGGSSQDALAQTGDSAQTLADAWKPNFKFKVKDKELEFEDSLKSLIKTKDLESKFRELHEKAYGIDEVKADRQTVKQERDEWKGKFGQVESSLQTLGSYVQKKDYHSFFSSLNIPKQDIINYAIQELKYQELPPEQKAAIDQQRQLVQSQETYAQQNNQLQQQLSQVLVQQVTFEMDQALARPDVSPIAQSYDARVGKPGAFKEEVIRRGQYYENVHKVSPPVSQLVSEILNLVGASPAQQGAGNTLQGQQQASQVVHNQQQKPVIPSFSGASAGKSPAKKIPTSVEDLRKMRQNKGA